MAIAIEIEIEIRDRSSGVTIIPTRIDGGDRFAVEQSMIGQNRTTTTTTTKTTRRAGQDLDVGQASPRKFQSNRTRAESGTPGIPEMDEKYLQSKIHITRKYKGKINLEILERSIR